MLEKMNPVGLVRAHFRTFYRYSSGDYSYGELAFQLLFPLAVVAAHFFWFTLDDTVISIVVSAAAIVAGLMLNLLVLVYTLVFNNRQNFEAFSNFSSFKDICKETLATISYSVLLCIILVVASFCALSSGGGVGAIGRALMVYTGTSTVLCLLIVLKRCFLLINFEFK